VKRKPPFDKMVPVSVEEAEKELGLKLDFLSEEGKRHLVRCSDGKIGLQRDNWFISAVVLELTAAFK